MNEFEGWDIEIFKAEISRLRDDLTRQTNEVTRLLRAESDLQTVLRQFEGAVECEMSDLKDSADKARRSAERSEHRAEAFKEVIAMLIGGAK